jgi:hypothetical protein
VTFELDAGGVHITCSSVTVTKKLIEKGARLVDESQKPHLEDGGAAEGRSGAPAGEADGSAQPAAHE